MEVEMRCMLPSFHKAITAEATENNPSAPRNVLGIQCRWKSIDKIDSTLCNIPPTSQMPERYPAPRAPACRP